MSYILLLLSRHHKKEHNFRFWTELGETNEERASKLKERQALRGAWKGALRGVLGRAL